ncbi:MAG: hypothetical protein LCH79_16360 [Proteobacteria bacterium]|nr:hypothetical protein [Pseudomonadota bacterium]
MSNTNHSETDAGQLATPEAQLRDIFNELGVQGHAGAVAEIRSLRETAGFSGSAKVKVSGEDDLAEAAYWEMDARIKGYNKWKGRPQSERDAFKAVVGALVSQVLALRGKP